MRTKSALSMKKATKDLFLSSSSSCSTFFCKGDIHTAHMTHALTQAASGAGEVPGMTYLACLLVEGNVCLHAKRPVDVDSIFVQLEQEDNENKDGIHHAE